MHHVTLSGVTAKLKELDSSATIYAAEPWTPSSVAVVAPEPSDGSVPPVAALAGCRYFLEVFIAAEVLEGWSGTPEEACRRLIGYAESDA